MENQKLYSVITGDIVGSKRIVGTQREHLMVAIKSSFKAVQKTFPGIIHAPFEIHRGDSFQGVLSKPELSLHAAIVIRANLRYCSMEKSFLQTNDARIAVGIGTIDSLPGGRVSEAVGEAFQRSGLLLDFLKKERRGRKRKIESRILIQTPWQTINEELVVDCALLDVIVSKWSAAQAQAIISMMRGLTQEEIAKEFGVSQPAIGHRLKAAGWWAVEELCERYKRLIHEAESKKWNDH